MQLCEFPSWEHMFKPNPNNVGSRQIHTQLAVETIRNGSKPWVSSDTQNKMNITKHRAVYFVVFVQSSNLGIETYSGYASLVAGWGNPILFVKPPKPLSLGPIFKSIGKYRLGYHLRSFTG
jgi:hypothetical protein